MAKIINYENLRIIVEKALRDNGFTDVKTINGVQVDMDSAWKAQLSFNQQLYDNPQNLQKLRDSIAQAISEAMSAYSVSGGITQGNNIVKNQNVSEDDGKVYLNADQSSNGAARVNDSILVSLLSDPLFFSWMTTVSTLNQSQAGTAASLLASIQASGGVKGKITTGSSSVKIGD